MRRSAALRAPGRSPPARTRAPGAGRAGPRPSAACTPDEDLVHPARRDLGARLRTGEGAAPGRQDDGMPSASRLSPDDASAALAALPMWSGGVDGIERTLELPSFRAA